MYLRGISIQNYRNLQPSSLGLAEGFWLILGANGHGKSNFLEAITVLCLGKSIADRDKDLIGFGEQFFRLEGRFTREERGDLESVVRMGPDGKEMLIFGTAVKRLAAFIGEASCVVFSAEDVDIVLGEPTNRRQFLNEAISQTSQGYIFDLSRYRRALDQKNRLLKDISHRLAPVSSLDVWNGNLAQYGGRVCARRARFIRRLGEVATSLYARLSNEAEVLEIGYEPSVPAPELPEQWPDAMLVATNERRNEEVQRGVSLVGPQRDDISLKLDGQDARAFASRGQARTIALSLRLAQAEIAQKQTGEWPILLLDDVFAELDGSRRGLLATIAAQAQQIFVTTASDTDVPSVEGLKYGHINVTKGSIEILRAPNTA
ncbi:MAG: DNA replication/repair protein RecF [Armatimonadota bacterium]